MPLIPIKISLDGDVVRPENDVHTSGRLTTRARRGDSVRWEIPQGFTGASITFDDGSPFGTAASDLQVPYGTLKVVGDNSPHRKFKYSCVLRDANGHEHRSAGGGELEIGNFAD